MKIGHRFFLNEFFYTSHNLGYLLWARKSVSQWSEFQPPFSPSGWSDDNNSVKKALPFLEPAISPSDSVSGGISSHGTDHILQRYKDLFHGQLCWGLRPYRGGLEGYPECHRSNYEQIPPAGAGHTGGSSPPRRACFRFGAVL